MGNEATNRRDKWRIATKLSRFARAANGQLIGRYQSISGKMLHVQSMTNNGTRDVSVQVAGKALYRGFIENPDDMNDTKFKMRDLGKKYLFGFFLISHTL
uniref:Uncharacterized protein n=1 Tax=Caenorhabditis japonica TaxID=281687 RepID=A0A8R1E4F2_CAEJA